MSWTAIPTNINTGVRVLRNLGWMGSAPDPSTISELVSNGYDPSLVALAVQNGATDEQLLALPYPADPGDEAAAIASLINQLSPQPSAPVTPASVPGVPAGSVVAYTATFTPTSNVLSPKFYSIDSVVAAIVQNLQNAWHISVIGQQSSGGVIGTPTISLTLQTMVAYGSLGDLKSVIDGAFYNAAGAKVTSSQIAITTFGAGSPAPAAPIGAPALNLSLPPGAASNISAWFQQNMGTVLFVIALIAIAPPLIKKL